MRSDLRETFLRSGQFSSSSQTFPSLDLLIAIRPTDRSYVCKICQDGGGRQTAGYLSILCFAWCKNGLTCAGCWYPVEQSVVCRNVSQKNYRKIFFEQSIITALITMTMTMKGSSLSGRNWANSRGEPLKTMKTTFRYEEDNNTIITYARYIKRGQTTCFGHRRRQRQKTRCKSLRRKTGPIKVQYIYHIDTITGRKISDASF